MSVNSDDYAFPGASTASFSKREWARAQKAAEKARKRIAATCKHIIKGRKKNEASGYSKEQAAKDKEDWLAKMEAAEREANGDYE